MRERAVICDKTVVINQMKENLARKLKILKIFCKKYGARPGTGEPCDPRSINWWCWVLSALLLYSSQEIHILRPVRDNS